MLRQQHRQPNLQPKFVSELQEAQDSELIGQPASPIIELCSSDPDSSHTIMATGDFTGNSIVVNGFAGKLNVDIEKELSTTTSAAAAANEFDYPEFENTLEDSTILTGVFTSIPKIRLIQLVASLLMLFGLFYEIFLSFVSHIPAIAISIVAAGFIMIGYLYSNRRTKRAIKWFIEDFSKDVINNFDNGFLTSPVAHDKSGEWRLVVRQQKFEPGICTSFGIICTFMPNFIEYVHIHTKFSVTTSTGKDLIPDWKDDSLHHFFGCEGDCSYTSSIFLSDYELAQCRSRIIVKCKLEFVRIERSWWTKYLSGCRREKGEDRSHLKKKKGQSKVAEFGKIVPERTHSDLDFTQRGAEFRGMTKFLKNRQTKSILWTIPDFGTHLLATDAWGIYSPQVFAYSQGFCSIWRMRLMELHGIFHVEFQLRGLPHGVSKIKAWYLVELMDNFGDFIAADACGTSVKYPTLLSIWSSTRFPLYRRQTLLNRFLQLNGDVVFRISIHTESIILDSDWVRHDGDEDEEA